MYKTGKMKTEIEARLFDIDAHEFIEKLKNLKAVFIFDRLQRRKCYDFNPIQKNSWIRLRTDGKVTTLAIKSVEQKDMLGTKELEIEVSNFVDTDEILNKLGYYARSYQENRRIEFLLDDVKIDIDFWPKLQPLIEFEAKNIEKIQKICDKLKINFEDLKTMNVENYYLSKSINIKNTDIMFLEDNKKAKL